MARSLRDPDVRSVLDEVKPGWRWEPMLLEVDGDRRRVYAGVGMRARLVRVLGPRRALRLARIVQQAAIFQPGRRGALKQMIGILTGIMFAGQAARSLAADPEPDVTHTNQLAPNTVSHPLQDVEIRASTRLTGAEAESFRKRALDSPDIQNIYARYPFDTSEAFIYQHDLVDGNRMWAIAFAGPEGPERSVVLYTLLNRPRSWLISQAAYYVKDGDILHLTASSINGRETVSPVEVKAQAGDRLMQTADSCGGCVSPFYYECYGCATVNWSCVLSICLWCSFCGPNLSCLVGCCGAAVYGCCQWGTTCCSCFGG